MAKIKIILMGGNGKMGVELRSILKDHPRAQFDSELGRLGRAPIEIKNAVVIDFSSPEGLSKALDFCVKNKLPLVSGTTGLKPAHFRKLKAASKKVPVLWAPNMSMGINLLLNLIEKVGGTFSGYDVQVEEEHHRHKKDSPSGTAISLQAALEQALGRRLPSIHSTRGGGVVGQHKISFLGDEEAIVIEHTAWSRKAFARGAISASVWINKRKPRLYTMRDVFNE